MNGFSKFLRLSVLMVLAWAFPVLLVVLGTVHSSLMPGLLVGLGLYFAFFREKSGAAKIFFRFFSEIYCHPVHYPV